MGRGRGRERKAQIIAAVYHANWINRIIPVTYSDALPPAGTGAGTSVNVNIGKAELNGANAYYFQLGQPDLRRFGLRISYNFGG